MGFVIMLTESLVREEFVKFFNVEDFIAGIALSYYKDRDIEKEYHTIKHLYDMLNYIRANNLHKELKPLQLKCLGYAILYHDAIYEIPSTKYCNEKRSADIALVDINALEDFNDEVFEIHGAIINTGLDLSERTYGRSSIMGILNIADIHTFFTKDNTEWNNVQSKVEYEYSKAYTELEILYGREKFFESLMDGKFLMKIHPVLDDEQLTLNMVKNIAIEYNKITNKLMTYEFKHKN